TIIGPAPAAALDDGSALSLGWRVVVQVRDADGAPVPGAQVEARDAAGNAVWSATTDAGGAIPTQIGIATERAGTQTVARSPLTIAVSKAGYAPETRTVPIGNHLQLTIPLSKP